VLQAESETLLQAIATAARIKARVVALDEREQTGIRSILNFGHTVGHALEALYGYRELLHGEAVAIGMKVAAGLSMDLGWLTQIEQARIDALLCATTLPLQLKRRFNPQKFLSYLKRDKKIHNGSLRLVLLKGLGEPVLTEAVSEAFLMKTISHRFDGRSF
jgi:3-dehydroquinate synthase